MVAAVDQWIPNQSSGSRYNGINDFDNERKDDQDNPKQTLTGLYDVQWPHITMSDAELRNLAHQSRQWACHRQ